jgi:hypothetical protein
LNFLETESVLPQQFYPPEAIMKKIGILIFAAAIILGIFVSTLFSFGRVSQNFFNFSFGKKTKGSGNLITETRDIKGFKGVDVSGIIQVEITAQKDFAVEVEADDNLVPLLKTEVRGGVLHIETVRRISTENGLKVKISAPDIESIDASGVSKVNLANLKNSELRVDTSGASKVKINGDTTRISIEVSGASSIDAENLRAEAATVNASGASHVSVFATGELRSHASGASKVVYLGNPKVINKDSSGASSIREE